jgi:hypothetical protein
MQIMPATARDEFGVAADELWDERLNVQLGLDYLARLHDQYGGRWDLALSHYNGGTLKGRGANAQPHSYTRFYVEKVLRWQRRYADQAAVWLATSTKPAKGGWTPARTRVSMTTADERHAPGDTYSQRRLRRRADADRINLAHGADLDDFASGRVERMVRRHRGTGSLSATVRWWDN